MIYEYVAMVPCSDYDYIVTNDSFYVLHNYVTMSSNLSVSDIVINLESNNDDPWTGNLHIGKNA